MAEEKKIEEVVKETVIDLQNKINGIKAEAQTVQGSNKEKVDEVVVKVSTALVNAGNKIIQSAKTISDEQEINKGIETVKAKSKELYDYAISKIDEFKNSDIIDEAKQVVENVVSSDAVENVVETVKQEAQEIKEEVSEFINKPEVQETIHEVKIITVEMAEKALATLKEWLKVDGEDKQ